MGRPRARSSISLRSCYAADPEPCPVPITGTKDEVAKAISTIQVAGFFTDSYFLMLGSTCINFLRDAFAGNQNVLSSLELPHRQEVLIKALYNPKQ